MKPIKHWGGLGPYDEYQGYQYHWYNRHYEFNGTRIRFTAGDMHAESEDENGGTIAPTFKAELVLTQDDIPEFYLPSNPQAEYDISWAMVIVWRWGFYLSIRGRVK